MSRHRIVRNLDLTEEYADHHDDEELTDEQHDLMAKGYAAVREVFPEDTGVTRKEIEDSLWYYYFDTSETVKWLLRTKKTADSQSLGPKKTGNSPKGEYRRCPLYIPKTLKIRTTTVASLRTTLAVSKAKNAIDWDSIARRPKGIRLGQCGLLGGASLSKQSSDLPHTSLSTVSKAKTAIDWDSIARRPKGIRLGQCGLLGGASSSKQSSDLPNSSLSSLAALAAKSANSTPPLRAGISGGLGLAALASRATSTSSGLGLRSLASQNIAPNDPNRTKTSLGGLAGKPSIPAPLTSPARLIPSSSTCFTLSKQSPALSKPSSSSLFAISKDRQTSPVLLTGSTNLPTTHQSSKPSPTEQPTKTTQNHTPISTFVIAQPSSFAVSIFESLTETPFDTTHVLIENSILASGGNPLADETKIASFAFDTQSPDDVVLHAQSLKGTGTKGGCAKESAIVTERN